MPERSCCDEGIPIGTGIGHMERCASLGHSRIGRTNRTLGKRNHRETGCGRAFGQALIGREKGAPSGPMLAPNKGRS